MTAQTVFYYEPFTHYFAADTVRVGTLAVGTMLVFGFIVLGLANWRVRRPVALALLSFAVSLTSQTSASAVGLGRPATWWLLDLRVVVLIFAGITFGVLVREAKKP
jgi:peptidoglycan/LPS O-acetylase OafA/YrhL